MNNTTKDIVSDENTHNWTVYLETSLLVMLCLFGITGNVLVMKTSASVETKFARQIMMIFLTLAVADVILCGIRIPILIFGMFFSRHHVSGIICFAWQMSAALFGIILWTNFVVGVQRMLIIYNFPLFKKVFTVKFILLILFSIWIIAFTVYIGISRGFGWSMAFKSDTICKFRSFGLVDDYIYRILLQAILGVVPLFASCSCHVWIVFCIINAGLTKLDNLEERSAYRRVNTTVTLRTIVLLIGWCPFLLVSMTNRLYNLTDTPYQKYLEYLICLQSVVSPYITLSDSDFKESNRNGEVHRLRSVVFRGSLPRNIKSGVTSGDMRSIRQSD